MRKPSRRHLAAVLITILLAGSFVACGGAEESNGSESATEENKEKKKRFWERSSDTEEEEEDKSVPVEITELGRGRIESILRFSTNLEAESEVQVISEASRKIRSLLVEEGDEVSKNQVLIRLQDEEQRNELARVQSQLANAKREYERRSNLYDQQLISEQNLSA